MMVVVDMGCGGSGEVLVNLGCGEVLDTDTNKNLVLTAETATQLHEGINLVLSRWTALRIVVNKCRSRDSAQKPQQLAQILFQALIQSKVESVDTGKHTSGDITRHGKLIPDRGKGAGSSKARKEVYGSQFMLTPGVTNNVFL